MALYVTVFYKYATVFCTPDGNYKGFVITLFFVKLPVSRKQIIRTFLQLHVTGYIRYSVLALCIARFRINIGTYCYNFLFRFCCVNVRPDGLIEPDTRRLDKIGLVCKDISTDRNTPISNNLDIYGSNIRPTQGAHKRSRNLRFGRMDILNPCWNKYIVPRKPISSTPILFAFYIYLAESTERLNDNARVPGVFQSAHMVIVAYSQQANANA